MDILQFNVLDPTVMVSFETKVGDMTRQEAIEKYDFVIF
jgi:hypothetical protein